MRSTGYRFAKAEAVEVLTRCFVRGQAGALVPPHVTRRGDRFCRFFQGLMAKF